MKWIHAIARDKRARIPFALIGILAILTSTMLVASVQMGEDPEPDLDEEMAMDRSEAAALGSLQTATERAIFNAAEAPITSVNDSHAIGEALHEANDGDVFENYVRLLIYAESAEQFQRTGQEFGDGTRTAIELPAIDPETDTTNDVVEKLERVDLEIGHESPSLETGKVSVSIEDVGLEVERKGDQVIDTSESFETTVATTLFELHSQTEEYEEQLQKGFFDGDGVYDGFGQYFGARLYAVAWMKSGMKYAVAPEESNPLFFDEIVPNNQSEVLANHAIYSLQEDVFGTSDPYSTRAMRSQAGCLLAQTAGEMADVDLAEEVCKGLDAIYGDIEGDQMDAPTASELLQMGLAEFDEMEEEMEVDIDMIAGIAVRDIQGVAGYDDPDDLDLDDLLAVGETVTDTVGEGEDIIGEVDQAVEDLRTELDELYDDVYTVETDATVTASNVDSTDEATLDFELDPPSPTDESDWATKGSPETVDVETTVLDATVTEQYEERSPEPEQTFHTVELEVTQQVTMEQGYEYVGCVDPESPGCPGEQPDDEFVEDSYEITVDPLDFEITGEFAPDVSERGADGRTLDYAFTDGGDVGFNWANYDGTPEYALNKTFDPYGELNICGNKDDVEVDVDESDVPTLIDAVTDNDWTTFADTFVNIEVRDLDHAQDILLKCFEWDYLPSHLENVLEPDDILDHRVDEAGKTAPGELESELEAALGEVEEPIQDEDHILELVGFEPSHELMAVPRIERYGWLGEETTDEYTDIKNWLDDELEEMVSGSSGIIEDNYPPDSLLGENDPSVEPASAPRYEFMDSSHDPILELVDNLRDVEEDIVYYDTEDDRYVNVMDLARTEMYRLFVQKTEDWIYDVNEMYNSALESVEDEVDANLEGVTDILDDGLDFLQDSLTSEPEQHAGELDAPLFEDVSFEIHGSPTYLSMDVAERDTVPTVRPGDEGRFAGLDDPRDSRPPASTNHSSFYSQYTNHLQYPGLPLLPWPFPWIASLSTWQVEVGGEYARFEVSATAGSPDRADPTTYVREQRPIELEFDGTDRHIGNVDAISFESSTWIVVVMPGGQPGVGDGGGSNFVSGLYREDCSITAPYLGPDFEDSERANEIDYDEIYPDNTDPIDDPC